MPQPGVVGYAVPGLEHVPVAGCPSLLGIPHIHDIELDLAPNQFLRQLLGPPPMVHRAHLGPEAVALGPAGAVDLGPGGRGLRRPVVGEDDVRG